METEAKDYNVKHNIWKAQLVLCPSVGKIQKSSLSQSSKDNTMIVA